MITLAAGSDFPVESSNPFFGIHAAVTRQDQGNQPAGGWLPGQKMTVTEALRAFTLDAAYAQHIQHSTRDPRLLEAAAALCENKLPIAEAILRPHLKRKPTDVPAIRMFAEVAARLSRYGDAEKLLARCLELAPSFAPARLQLAFVLNRAGKPAEALAQIDRLLGTDPRNPAYRNLKAGILTRIGEVEGAAELYSGVLAEYAGHPKVWMSYGHALKSAGRQPEAIKAYRRALELWAPGSA